MYYGYVKKAVRGNGADGKEVRLVLPQPCGVDWARDSVLLLL